MKTHTDAFVGRPRVPAAESKINAGVARLVYLHAVKVHAVSGGCRANNGPAGSHETLPSLLRSAEVTTRGPRRGNMGMGAVVLWRTRPGERNYSAEESIDTAAADRQTDRQTDGQPAVTTAPVCCKLKRIRGPTTVKTMTSLLHHMSPCNKRK